MTASRLMTKPVTLRRPERDDTDAYGQPVVTWEPVPAVCHFRRMYSDDASGVGVIVTDTIQFWFPPGTEVDEDWEIDLGGEIYAVVGDAHAQWNARLERVEYVTVNARRRSL